MKTNLSCYTHKELKDMASDALKCYRKAHKGSSYIFDDTPWFISVSDNGTTLNVQIKNRETNWVENTNIAL